MLASKLEFHIKKNLSKRQKEELIQNPDKLEAFLGEKLDASLYKKVNKIDDKQV